MNDSLMVTRRRQTSSRSLRIFDCAAVSNHEVKMHIILGDAAKTPLLRMRKFG
jgi:hypothetical protein